ncbi:MAG: hypothetical protein ACK5H2_08670 [Beutenbergiaceae bacterium]
MLADVGESFDLIFIDADKPSNPRNLAAARAFHGSFYEQVLV